MSRSNAFVLTILACASCVDIARSNPVDWVVDPLQSMLTLSIADQVIGGPLYTGPVAFRNQVGTSPAWTVGNQAAFGGLINSFYDESSQIIALNGSALWGQTSGNYRPDWPNFAGTYLTPATAPAVFGGKVQAVSGIDSLYFSMTNAQLNVLSGPEPLTGSSGSYSFDTSSMWAFWPSLRLHTDNVAGLLAFAQIWGDERGIPIGGVMGSSGPGSAQINPTSLTGFDREMTVSLPFSGILDFPFGTTNIDATLSFVAYANIAGPGSSQSNPILPAITPVPGDPWIFDGPSGNWFDPPVTSAFDFEMLGDSLFTSIAELPSGFDGPFTVSVGGIVLGSFLGGSSVVFADFENELGNLLIDGQGVLSFRISDIDPTVDLEDPTAFPVKLGFSTLYASFSMTPIPEPSSFLLAATCVLFLPVVARTSRRAVQR